MKRPFLSRLAEGVTNKLFGSIDPQDLGELIKEVRPYYSFKGIISQSNDAGVIENKTSGTLEIGVSYKIDTFNEGDDFTNVGASSNAAGVSFIATGTTPAVWTEESSLSSHTANIEVLKIHNDDFGDCYFKRNSQGAFTFNSMNTEFSDDKTEVIINGLDQYWGNIITDTEVPGQSGKGQRATVNYYHESNSSVWIETAVMYVDATGINAYNMDGIIYNFVSFEVRVYQD